MKARSASFSALRRYCASEGRCSSRKRKAPAPLRRGFSFGRDGREVLYIYTAMTQDENVLSSLPGEIIGAAMSSLPPAETCKDEFREVIIDDPTHGITVRIRFTRFHHRWRKQRRWFWVVDSALRIEDSLR